MPKLKRILNAKDSLALARLAHSSDQTGVVCHEAIKLPRQVQELHSIVEIVWIFFEAITGYERIADHADRVGQVCVASFF